MSEIIGVVEALAKYIKAEIPAFRKALVEFPRPDQELDLPSLSVTTEGRVETEHWMPTEYSIGMVNEDGITAQVDMVSSQYELPLSLDIWAEYKAQRAELYNLLTELFYKNYYGHGLTLKVPRGTPNTFARYTMMGYNFLDNSELAAKGEWRANISVTAHFDKLISRSLPLMKNIQVKQEVST